MTDHIRDIIAEDRDALKRVLESSGLFPPEELDGMIAPYLNGTNTTDIWFTYAPGNVPVAFGYCVPERLTEGTCNLLAIAVDASEQGKGIGTRLMRYLETRLQQAGGRILIVETSGDAAYSDTRRFYERNGYEAAATLKDFWKEGEDKIIFYKRL